jgi:hypothetical protein
MEPLRGGVSPIIDRRVVVFAHTVSAQKGHDLSGVHGKRDILQDVGTAVKGVDLQDLQDHEGTSSPR